VGPHRDDIELLLEGRPMRAFGSQGEQRACALALRLGVAATTRELTGEVPLVLLDDVLSELDSRYRAGVFGAVSEYEQMMVTCCDLADVPQEVRDRAQVFELREGRLV
jgi:DNA replication and repair protein RecF